MTEEQRYILKASQTSGLGCVVADHKHHNQNDQHDFFDGSPYLIEEFLRNRHCRAERITGLGERRIAINMSGHES
jgi:hypothetical protein